MVLQVSLETGCKSFGIEIQPLAAGIAREQLEQFKTRCRMWGVRMGDVELEEGDMLKSKRVDELIAKADVVLINNKVFEGARKCLVFMLFMRLICRFARGRVLVVLMFSFGGWMQLTRLLSQSFWI